MVSLKNKRMITPALLVTLMLTGCGGGSGSSSDSSSTGQSSNRPSIEQPSPTEGSENTQPDPSPVSEPGQSEVPTSPVPEPDPKTLADFMPVVDIRQSNKISKAGESYDGDFEVTKSSECLNGTIEVRPVTNVAIQTNSSYSTEDLVGLLKIKGSIGIPHILGGQARLLHSITETDRSVSAVAVYSTEIEERTFKLNQSDPLTDIAKQYLESGGPYELRQKCGDSFAYKTTLGAHFIVSYEFLFSSSSMKSEFRSKVNASLGDFVPLEASIRAYREHFKQNGSLNVTILQTGGDRSISSRALQITDKETLFECRSNGDACLDIVDKVNAFVASSEFEEALTSSNPEITSVTMESLSNVLPSSIYPKEAAQSYISDDIRSLRENLQDEIIKREKALKQLAFEVNHYGAASPEEKLRLQAWSNSLTDAQVVIESDLDDLNDAYVTCFNNVNSCLEQGQTTLEQVSSIPEVEHRRIWFDTGVFYDRGNADISCQLPDWSFINSVKQSRHYSEMLLGYYNINPITGLLSEKQYLYCGHGGTFEGEREFAGSFREVSLPEGYGVVALKHRTDEHILGDVLLVGKRWIPEMFAVGGEPVTRSSGTDRRMEGSATLPEYQMASGAMMAEANSSSLYTVLRGASIK